MRSPISNHTFAQFPSVSIPRSSFRRDRTYKTSFNANDLVPIFLDEVLPGDTFNLRLTSFARLSTPIVPIMDNLYMDYFFFFVPTRLVWEHWEEFNGYQPNPQLPAQTDYLIPQFNNHNNSFLVGSLADYFGLPVGVGHLSVSALPFRAYNLIWNEFFRDENFQQPVPVYTDDGPDPHQYTPDVGPDTPVPTYKLLKRGKRKDYFTSCLPSPQKGPGIEIPIAQGWAAVENWKDSAYSSDASKSSPFNPKWTDAGTSNTAANLYVQAGDTKAVQFSISGTVLPSPKLDLGIDFSNLTAVTINSLRTAFQIQRLYERDALGGTRYFETLVAHFGVRSPDARLQRPEYLGGGTVPIQIHTVAQTSETGTTPQGNLAAIGVAGTNQVGFSKSFVEHGYIIGLVNVRADLTYQQGIDRMWSRKTRFDFYWPALAHLGEQAVLNKEIYAQGSNVTDNVGNIVDDLPFGYQERWAEYRYGVSKITGKLRSGVAGSLDVWHLAQSFASLPFLNEEFIEEDVPLARVLAVQDEPQIIYDSLVSVNCVRPMPVYSVPGLVDHF